MSRSIAETDAAQSSGVFGKLGDFIVQWPWLVIAFWLTVAAVLPMQFPSLAQLAQEQPIEVLPADSPANAAAKHMSEAFNDPCSDNLLLVVLTSDKELNSDDELVYRTMVDRLRRDTQNVETVTDFLSTPPLREFLTGEDQKAWVMPVCLAGVLGTPQSFESYSRAVEIVKGSVAGTALTANLTGPAATAADLTDAGALDRQRIHLAIAILLVIILLIIYRNPITMLLPLVAIGVSALIAQGVVAGMAEQLGLGVSDQTMILLSGIMAGAGTDYSVFLISRYHDFLRLGAASDEALKSALSSIGKVILASAATTALTFLGMMFAVLGIFAAAGPALAIGVTLAFLAAVTLLPAIIVVAGRLPPLPVISRITGSHGWIAPRRDLTSRFWRRSGIRIVRRPWTNLILSLLLLIVLASSATVIKFNYDDRKALPDSSPSSVGYAAMDRHFPGGTLIPQYLLVESPNDLRTQDGLADLEEMARRVSELPGIEKVRGITRPFGDTYEQFRLSWQAGEVGVRLDEGANFIADNSGQLDQLASGANTLADGLFQARPQVIQALAAIRPLLSTFTTLQNQFGGSTMLQDLDTAAQLITAMQSLGNSLDASLASISANADWAGPVMAALDASPICNTDPRCGEARVQLRQLITALNDGTFDRFTEVARKLQGMQGTNTLASTATTLRNALGSVNSAMRTLGIRGTGGLPGNLGSMEDQVDELVDGSRQLADGVQLLVDQTKEMGTQLGTAADFLLGMKNDATTPSAEGFYIPAWAFSTGDFRQAAKIFISPDGHSVRYLIQSSLDPFSTAAMDQVSAIAETARGAQPNTTLANADISMVGFTSSLKDTRDFYTHDARLMIVWTIVVVLLVLILLLRAIVAPLYLIASVIVSYFSAIGLGVIMFQFILGQELHWSIPGLTFVILIAVGADYNMLLISRIRDESTPGIRSGVIRTVGLTGGVITAAGVIFAASMFGLLFSSIGIVVQSGFVVGVGILLDTFVVRTVTVPAIATLAGRANWWPSSWGPGARPLDSWPTMTRGRIKSGARSGVQRVKRVYSWQ